MANTRNAGRKPKLSDEQLNTIIGRYKSGETLSSLALEAGISKQALSKRIKNMDASKETTLDYYIDGKLCTRISIDTRRHSLRIINYTTRLSRRAFGYIDNPNWTDLQSFLDEYYEIAKGIKSYNQYIMTDSIEDIDILRDNASAEKYSIVADDNEAVPRFFFSKKEKVLNRTDTNGYQLKGTTHNRRYFVKSQAIMSGVVLNDHLVEVIASDICRQLSIPCVQQKLCRFIYEGKSFEGVYSENFELDGYTFISFESLLNRQGLSTKDEDFIALDSISKLKWCAKQLSVIGRLEYKDTLKYMLDLAITDCLIGNVDRHTRNFGLFYNAHSTRYEIPLVFDNGMGLFENDYYRDSHNTFDEAMRNVYVAPYGEDPFDMIIMLNEEFDLSNIYPALQDLTYPDILTTEYALEYERRMSDYVRTKIH